jgi:hypothetical protein
MRSYYITPRRLMANTFLWKSINMMKIINKERIFEVPASTREWLMSNWTVLTPENAVLCIEYSDKHLEYAWDNNPIASEKIMDVLINSEEYRTMALKNKHLREEALVNFIEGKHKEEVATDAVRLKSIAPSSWRRIGAPEVHSWTGAILQRAKRYQVEYLYKVYTDNYGRSDIISFLLADHCPLKMIPDYIFQEMVPHFYVNNDSRSYNSSWKDVEILREAINRGMMTRVVSTRTTIEPEARPTTFAPPSVPPIAVPAPDKGPKWRPLTATTMILLPKKVGP